MNWRIKTAPDDARAIILSNKKGRLIKRPFLFDLLQPIQNMVGRAGFEPATNWLKANCSTD